MNSANSKGLKPIYWDIDKLMFDWSTGAITDKDTVRALTGGAALPPPPARPMKNNVLAQNLALPRNRRPGGPV